MPSLERLVQLIRRQFPLEILFKDLVLSFALYLMGFECRVEILCSKWLLLTLATLIGFLLERAR